MTDLKDCPFCGFHADREDEDVLHISGAWIEEPESNGYKFRHYTNAADPRKTGYCYVINCVQHYGGCGASISGDSVEEVVAKWNSRVDYVRKTLEQFHNDPELRKMMDAIYEARWAHRFD